MGIPLAFGCDVPASPYQEPKWAFRGAVVRRSSSGVPLTQTEKLTIQEALRIHTMGSAYASFSEDSTGSLETGKYADMVIWSHDLYTITALELNDLASEMTIVGGTIRYDAGKNPFVSVSEENECPNCTESFQLMQNYPNPFNPSTRIRYAIPLLGGDERGELVTLKVYDILGNEIAVLVNEEKSPGNYEVEFSAKGGSASGGNSLSNALHLASGIYYYRLQAGD